MGNVMVKIWSNRGKEDVDVTEGFFKTKSYFLM